MAKAKTRSVGLKKSQIFSIHNLGYVGYLIDGDDVRISEKVFLINKYSNNRYIFVDDVDGFSFVVEEGQTIKALRIESLILNEVVGEIDLNIVSPSTGLLNIKNIYVEV